MMELSTEKTNGSVHNPFVYPTDLRVLGYAAGVLPTSTSSSGSTTAHVMSPLSPNLPIVTTPVGSFTLPRSLMFSDAEKAAAAAFLWTSGTNPSLSPDPQHHHQSDSLKNGNNNSSNSNHNAGNGGQGHGSPGSLSPPIQQSPSPTHQHPSQQQQQLGPPTSSASGHHATPGNAQLMHWMSAVMAEHINHHAVDGVHYVWNGAVEGKLNSPESHHHNNSVKSEIDPTSPTLSNSLYGAPRSNNSTSSISSSPPSSAGLVVPQPLSSAPGNGKAPTTNGGGGRKYQCKMCPQVGIFTSKADLQLHTQIHMREAKPYKCSQCTKAFANSSYLSQHTRIHLGSKPYRCEICQRKFTQLSHLQQHIRTHTGDKPYKCRHPGCNKAFSQLSNLQSHSRCHQTDKPYKCNSCYKCFTDEAALLDHIPKHKESKHLKTHICHFCGKSYTQETYLTKHMQKHTEKAEKKSRNNNNNSNNVNGNHHHTNGTSSNNTTTNNQNSHQVVVSNHQGSTVNNNVLGTEIYWKTEIGESSPPSMCLSSGPQGTLLVGRQGSEGPDDLRSAMLQLPSNMGGGGVAGGARTYLPYETLTFPKPTHHHQMSAMDMKSPTNAFPNQLISLHQIRNYAHQPSSMTPEHILGLKDNK